MLNAFTQTEKKRKDEAQYAPFRIGQMNNPTPLDKKRKKLKIWICNRKSNGSVSIVLLLTYFLSPAGLVFLAHILDITQSEKPGHQTTAFNTDPRT